MLWTRLHQLNSTLRLGELGVARGPCPACDCPWLLRLARSESGVRCPRCGASAVTQSLISVLRARLPDLSRLAAYEMSAQGPLVRFLRKHCAELTTSELLDGVAPGAERGGVVCQNVEQLTFPDAVFDLCTSTEVFEHVEDDRAGFREIYRVLRPGGQFLFTVPLSDSDNTTERTLRRDGQRIHVLPPTYHADRYRGAVILVHRDYGRDIVQRVQQAGFVDAQIVPPPLRLFGHARQVIVARRPPQ